ncbi:hypothetical protein F5Y14DRAFT_446455 [Nemania sp. NC0429]|nr:hypothetical protein F5Y14DRAFT_446455 [Nemania sp. NC0429]
MEKVDGYRYSCDMYGLEEGFPPEPKKPGPARYRTFTYDDTDGFRASKFSRASLADLRLIFRKNASAGRRAIATKPWITAQLRLYDIPFRSSADADELFSTLGAAVSDRKCIEGGPPSIDALERRLQTTYCQSWVDYDAAVERHKLAVDAWHYENFSKLDDPSAEVRCDVKWFFSKYFVDDKGLPAPDKRTEPIILWDMHDYLQELRCHVDAIPGLSAKMTACVTVIAWAQELDRGVDMAFEMIDRPSIKLDHPTLEAYFDADRFLAKYFLDGLHGQPAREKQREPLVLKSYIGGDKIAKKLIEATQNLPDLLVEETVEPSQDWRGKYSEDCVVVGWVKQVVPLAKSLELAAAQAKEREARREERNREKRILAKVKPHIDYARAHRPAPSGPFTLHHLVGSYIMHCRELQRNYGCDLGSMTLDIHAPTSAHGALAAFNFGVVEGTMLLAPSEEALELLREEQPPYQRDDYYDEDSGEDVGMPGNSIAPGKRRAATATQTRPFKRRLGVSEPAPTPGRFYLQWAGCETSTSYLIFDDVHTRSGYFDLDKSGLTARGRFRYEGMFDDPLVFTLLKVADKPRQKPDAWSSYCEEERWRHW